MYVCMYLCMYVCMYVHTYIKPLVLVPDRSPSVRRVQTCSEMHVAAETHTFHPIVHSILGLAGEKQRF